MKNNRKMLVLAAALALTFALAACGAKDKPAGAPENEPQPQEDAAPQNDASQTDSYAGEYTDRVSQRAMMTLAQDGDTLRFTVSWGSSAAETTEWTMSGTLSEDGTRVDYTDGKCVNNVYEEGKTEPAQETVYENGSGHFEVADGTFTWMSDNDEFSESCVFEPMA